MLASYLSAHAGVLKTATLVRRLASISKAHRARGLPNHAQSELVRTTLRGIRRKHGTRQAEARPLLKDELFQVLDAIGDELRDARDRALLLIGFAGGFRRSELVSLNIEDLEFVRQGVVITLSRSKTDQTGAGRKIAIPLARGRWCPVVALEDLIRRSGTTAGAVFRSINRYGHVGQERLSGEAVSLIIRARMQAAGLRSDGYSGHSLRAGFATSAAQAGVATSKIRLQTGHKSDAMLARYIRDGDLFLNNAAGVVL
jgi:integrase